MVCGVGIGSLRQRQSCQRSYKGCKQTLKKPRPHDMAAGAAGPRTAVLYNRRAHRFSFGLVLAAGQGRCTRAVAHMSVPAYVLAQGQLPVAVQARWSAIQAVHGE